MYIHRNVFKKRNLPLTFRDRVLHFEKFPMKFNFT